MNRKKIKLRLLAVLLSTAVLSACSSNTTLQGNVASQNQSSEASSVSKTSFVVTSDMITYDKYDYYTDWKNESPNYVELNGNSASLKGSGATVKDGKISITAAGVYVLSGKLDNGQIIVDVEDKGTVKLVLNGAEIRSLDSSPIYVKNAGKAIISLQEGTENTVTDGEKYVLEDASSDEPNAAIFSKADLIINGNGSLKVSGNYNNGITSKDDLKVTGGNINIYAKDDGLMGKDLLVVKEGNIKIEAGVDGMKSTNDTEETKGFVGLQGGTFDIKSGSDGIQAVSSILIAGGKYNIVTGGGSSKAPEKVKEGWGRPMGNKDKTASNTTAAAAEDATPSAKGIKAALDISISGGSLSIDSYDDSVHSNNSINIAAGDLSITSGDDGIHADSSLNIKGGKINITKSYEGVESALINFEGGETHIVASDDGVNVGGGADGSSVNGRPGQNEVAASANNKLNINGGYISVNAEGDGLDSNGYIYMTNGTAVVSGPTSNGNGALDYNGDFVMSGGVLVAAGSSGMAQAPSDSSTQYSIAMSFSTAQQAGTLVALKDSKGNTIAAFAPEKQYETVVVSSPELKKDGEYTIYSGGTASGTLSDGLYKDGEQKDGTKVVGFTTANSVTWLNESGVTEARSGHQGGPGGQGGQRGPGGKGNRAGQMPPDGEGMPAPGEAAPEKPEL